MDSERSPRSSFSHKNTKFNHKKDDLSWIIPIRDKLFTMFCSPMREDYANEAYKWVAKLNVVSEDLSWISPDDQWSDREVIIFHCISKLSAGEVTILIPLVQRHLTCGDQPDTEDGKILSRSANNEDYEMLGCHFCILESVVKSLVRRQIKNGEDYSNNLTRSMKTDQMNSLLKTMQETILVICSYLDVVNANWVKLLKEEKSVKYYAALGAIRLVSVWLTEDPSMLESQCRSFLIDLMIKNLSISELTSSCNMMILALWALCDQNDDLRQVIKKSPLIVQAIDNYLAYVDNEKDEGDGPESQRLKEFKLKCGFVKDIMR